MLLWVNGGLSSLRVRVRFPLFLSNFLLALLLFPFPKNRSAVIRVVVVVVVVVVYDLTSLHEPKPTVADKSNSEQNRIAAPL